MQAFAFCEIGQHHSLLCAPHEHFLVHFVLGGDGYIDSAEGRFDLRHGSVALVPPMTGKSLNGSGPIHHFLTPAASGTPIDGIDRISAFDREPDLVLVSAALDAGLRRSSRFLATLETPLVVSAPQMHVDRHFSTMRAEMLELREGSRAFLSAVMKRLTMSMMRSDQAVERKPPVSPMIDPRLQRAVHAVMMSPAGRHSVATLAKEAAMSRSSFSSQFLEAYGLPPMTFVQSVRLAQAATLLVTSKMAIKAIAAAVGYSSRSQFSNAFRDKYGKDPTTYRAATSEAR